MENVEVSTQYKSTSSSVPSPTAAHIACLNGARLQVRCLTTYEIVRSIPLPSSHDLRSSKITWSPPVAPPLTSSTSRPSSASTPPRRSSRTPRPCSNRLLISDDDTTRVYDLRDDKWHAVISNGSGGMGKNVHVDFGANEDEVLVWSDFTACVKIWCLRTGRVVEIRDPKYVGKEGKGWGYRPCDASRGEGSKRGCVLALLCRASGTDILLLLAARTYKILNRVELPTTDAAGLKWSRDGRWLAIWDAASAGYKLCIYTADGHLYRTIVREISDEPSEWDVEGLGIKTVEWVPGNERLAVGGWDRRVRILSTKTFAPVVFLDHTAVIHVPSAPVYTEHVDSQGNRTYALTPQPTTPPKPPLEKNESSLMKQGIGMLAFNAKGTLCATRDDSTPSTVWIWDLRSLKPRCILVQHAAVKNLLWHTCDPDKLLVQTHLDEPTVYLYTASGHQAPAILTLDLHISKPAGSASAKWTSAWLAMPVHCKPVVLFGHQQGHVLVWPEGKDEILTFENEDEGQAESDDSLYDILTGRTPVPGFREEDGVDEGGSVDTVGGLEDTFREKRGRGDGGGLAEKEKDEDEEQSLYDEGVLGESGLDEMF